MSKNGRKVCPPRRDSPSNLAHFWGASRSPIEWPGSSLEGQKWHHHEQKRKRWHGPFLLFPRRFPPVFLIRFLNTETPFSNIFTPSQDFFFRFSQLEGLEAWRNFRESVRERERCGTVDTEQRICSIGGRWGLKNLPTVYLPPKPILCINCTKNNLLAWEWDVPLALWQKFWRAFLWALIISNLRCFRSLRAFAARRMDCQNLPVVKRTFQAKLGSLSKGLIFCAVQIFS